MKICRHDKGRLLMKIGHILCKGEIFAGNSLAVTFFKHHLLEIVLFYYTRINTNKVGTLYYATVKLDGHMITRLQIFLFLLC